MIWRLIESEASDAYTNMAIDEVLFARIRQYDGTLRIYTWKNPAISIGRHERPDDINLGACRRDGIEVVRRPTGGGTVYHRGDLSFSLIGEWGGNGLPRGVRESYRFIHAWVIEALKYLGIKSEHYKKIGEQNNPNVPKPNMCFFSPIEDDVIINNKKVAGGAQRRDGRRILHQATLNLNPATEEMRKYFYNARLQAPCPPFKRARNTGVKELRDALKESFGRISNVQWRDIPLRRAEIELIRELAKRKKEKYQSSSW